MEEAEETAVPIQVEVEEVSVPQAAALRPVDVLSDLAVSGLEGGGASDVGAEEEEVGEALSGLSLRGEAVEQPGADGASEVASEAAAEGEEGEGGHQAGVEAEHAVYRSKPENLLAIASESAITSVAEPQTVVSVHAQPQGGHAGGVLAVQQQAVPKGKKGCCVVM